MSSRRLKLKTFAFDVDLSEVYLIPDIGPCFKTKAWSFYIPIYGNYEAIELDISDLPSTIILNDSNASSDVLVFYRQEIIKQIFKINSKVMITEFKIQQVDINEYINKYLED